MSKALIVHPYADFEKLLTRGCDEISCHEILSQDMTMFLVKVTSCRVVVRYPSGLGTRLETIHGDRVTDKTQTI